LLSEMGRAQQPAMLNDAGLVACTIRLESQWDSPVWLVGR
jgi:neutral trehalase